MNSYQSSDSFGDVSGTFSRWLAKNLLRETGGRSVSRMVADNSGTSVAMVHLIGTAAFALVLAKRSKQQG